VLARADQVEAEVALPGQGQVFQGRQAPPKDEGGDGGAGQGIGGSDADQGGRGAGEHARKGGRHGRLAHKAKGQVDGAGSEI
jgi:hypothetical protein